MGLFDIFKKKKKPTLEETYMARDLREIENSILSMGGFTKTEDKEAYIYKIFFSSEVEGGFGLPIEKKDEIMGGYIKSKTSSICLGLYKKGKNLNNYLLEYARIFFGKGLKEADYLVMCTALDRIHYYWAKIYRDSEIGQDSIQIFYRNFISNPESFLYDQRLYQGDRNFVEYKINFCFNVFYFDNFSKLREQMTEEEVLSAQSIAYLERRESELSDEENE